MTVERTPTPRRAASPRSTAAVDPLPREIRPYQGQRAGVVSRFVAGMLDVVVVAVVLSGGYLAWTLLLAVHNRTNFSFPQVSLVGLALVGMWLSGVYLFLGWVLTGRTLGDRVMGLRVVSFRGELMSFVGAAVRAAFCVLVPIGLLWVVVSPSNRSLQDTVLRTSVVYDWQSIIPRRQRQRWTRRRRGRVEPDGRSAGDTQDTQG